jgi:hypothetical protein
LAAFPCMPDSIVNLPEFPAAAAQSGGRIGRAVGSAYTAAPGNWAPASPIRAVGGVYTGQRYDVDAEGQMERWHVDHQAERAQHWAGLLFPIRPTEPQALDQADPAAGPKAFVTGRVTDDSIEREVLADDDLSHFG